MVSHALNKLTAAVCETGRKRPLSTHLKGSAYVGLSLVHPGSNLLMPVVILLRSKVKANEPPDTEGAVF